MIKKKLRALAHLERVNNLKDIEFLKDEGLIGTELDDLINHMRNTIHQNDKTKMQLVWDRISEAFPDVCSIDGGTKNLAKNEIIIHLNLGYIAQETRNYRIVERISDILDENFENLYTHYHCFCSCDFFSKLKNRNVAHLLDNFQPEENSNTHLYLGVTFQERDDLDNCVDNFITTINRIIPQLNNLEQRVA